MAKININFNNTDYSIDESSLATPTAELKSHLSTAMSGTGAMINLGGVEYSIDSEKLSTARDGFVSRLGAIAGSDSKIVVGGAEYGIDANKVSGAVTGLHATLGELESGGGGGDEPVAGNYLTFSSPSSFTLNIGDNTKYWDGTLEYSTDTNTWSVWDGTTTLSADDGKLYMRGTGNTNITGDGAWSSQRRWVLTGSDISCIGNIENLLDYPTVANGEHPTMAAYCYRGMFFNCESLTATPELPATTLAYGCYSSMFSGCTSLTAVPELPATTLAEGCYLGMFSGCTSLKLSTKQTDEYTIAYRIPTSGTGTTVTNALINMFKNTGGTFKGTPSINTTYYLHKSNSVV